MKLTVALCTYKRYDLLRLAIESLTRQTLPQDQFEVLVVDNSPDRDGSGREQQQYEHVGNLRWVHEAIPGLSNARNVAMRLADAPLIAYLDDDAIADPVWAESLCRTFAEFGETCHVIGGKVRPLWSEPRPVWLADEMLGYVSVVDHGDEARFLTDQEWVAGANIAYRTEVLRRFGGFDVSLGRVGSGSSLMSNEEVALTDRIKAHGGRVVYDPIAAVDHLVEAARLRQSWFRRRVAWQAVSDRVRGAVSSEAVDVERAWNDIKDFFLHCPPSERTVRALALQQNDPGMFRWQLATIYNFTSVMLSGMHEVDDE
ncbi:MAG TPA: glycosyltransferase [Roseomonas sp.]|nr:glycosyltransferase [Roseomonas sp.]